MNIEGVSLDQLRAVLAVAEIGSFSGAARRFGRAQSAVSYAVAQTEAQLGVELFDRSGYRPVLTPAGRLLLHDIRGIVARADDLHARAQAVARGVEAELTLVVDAVLSPRAVSLLLAKFHAVFPTVPVRVHVETLGMVIERVLEAKTALGLIATMTDLPAGLTRHTMPPLSMRAVAAPCHPLAGAAAEHATEIVQSSVQIVLSERGRRTAGRDYAVFSQRTWRVDDLAVKHKLIAQGVGWGSLPAWMAERDLAEGLLTLISIPGLPDNDELTVQAFHDAGHKPGPAVNWLITGFCGTGAG
jgi:DNA-binding transcriptional LysR family regulator